MRIIVNENKQLKNVGLKITMPRLKILQILESANEHHLSAEDVYKALSDMGEDVSLATVYRVLTQFEASGLINRHDFADGYFVFELSQNEHHDHLVCTKCGRIEEFLDEVIEKRQIQIAKQAGYKMTDHVLNIYGICPDCNS
jgi:Fur family transcriptional regulator, ferric uptake regulator